MITRYGVDPICFPLPWKFPNTQGVHLEKPSPAKPKNPNQVPLSMAGTYNPELLFRTM